MNRLLALPISAFALVLATSFVFAESAPEAQLPSIVQRAIKEHRQSCATSSRLDAFLTEQDVNGDGRKDYILNYANFQCDGQFGYCGSAGCAVQVFVSRNDTYLQALDETVLAVEFEIVKGKPAMLIYRRGTACGKDYSTDCIFVRIWDGRRFLPE